MKDIMLSRKFIVTFILGMLLYGTFPVLFSVLTTPPWVIVLMWVFSFVWSFLIAYDDCLYEDELQKEIEKLETDTRW